MVGYLIVALIDIAVAIYAFRALRNKTGLAFAALWLSFGIWELNLFLSSYITDIALLEQLFHPLRIGMFFIAPSLIAFFAAIIRRPITGWLKTSLFLSAATSLTLTVSSIWVIPSTLVRDTHGYSTSPDLLSTIHEANFLTACLICISITGLAYRLAQYREKQRMLWLLSAVLTGSVFGILSFDHSKAFGMAGNLIGLSMMLYALIRYRVVDIRFAMSNATIRSIILLSLVSIFFGFSEFIKSFNISETELFLSTAVLFIAGMEVYGPIRRYLTNMRDQYFFKEYYQLDTVKDVTTHLLGKAVNYTGLKPALDWAIITSVKSATYKLYMSSIYLQEAGDSPNAYLEIDLENGRVQNQADKHKPSINNTALVSLLSEAKKPIFYDEVDHTMSAVVTSLGASAFVPIHQDSALIAILELGTPHKPEEFSHNDQLFLTWLQEALVPAINRIVSQEQLLKSLNDAEKLISLVGRINEVGHDVKSPLTNIEALVRSEGLFTKEEADEMIIQQVKKAHSLVSTMTKMLRGQHRSEMSSFSINDVIMRIADSFPTYRPIMSLELNEDLPPVFGYEHELEILISNLISNAIEAKQDANHWITIRTWVSEDNKLVWFSIFVFFLIIHCTKPIERN